MSSGEDHGAELRQLVSRLIPVAKARAIRAAELSPETFAEELWTLGALYIISGNLSND